MNRRSTTWWGSIAAVFEFESRRALVVSKIAWWCVLTLFPVAIVSLCVLIPMGRRNVPVQIWEVILFILIPLFISMLGTFMWTCSAVSAELERQSWVYLAVRPKGRVAVIVGKFLVAITWVLPATLVGTTLSILVTWLAGTSLAEQQVVFRTWWAMVRLCCLSVPAYAAIYLALGTIFTKRAMVISVAYTLVFELLVSFVPALINKLTIHHRLRALFLQWAEIDPQASGFSGSVDLFTEEPAWRHVMILTAYMLALVILSIWLVRRREYLVSVSADVS